ncbi:MAG TPA: hypothetical protein VGC04_04425 [Cellulomonas sp.]
MKVVACLKAAPEAEDIATRPDRTLDLERAAWKIGTYDLNAVEAARVLADQTGGVAVGLSVGGAALAGSKFRKDALSRGLDELVVVSDDALADLDSFQTATVLRDALLRIGDVDVVLLGAGSSDVYAQQVGNELGALLGAATLNGVNKITLAGDHLVVERPLENVVQILEVELPAVLSLTSGINTPRIPGMRDVLAAGKRPTSELAGIDAPAPSAERTSLLAVDQVERAHRVIDGDTADVVAQLVDYLDSMGGAR